MSVNSTVSTEQTTSLLVAGDTASIAEKSWPTVAAALILVAYRVSMMAELQPLSAATAIVGFGTLAYLAGIRILAPSLLAEALAQVAVLRSNGGEQFDPV